MLPKIREIDPERKHFDLIAFDGAANVQKAGMLINQYFPGCSVIVGLEHTVSLVCGKVCTLSVSILFRSGTFLDQRVIHFICCL
jgi:hypothetical protein